MWSIISAQPSHVPVLTDIIRSSNQDVAQRFQLTARNAPKHPSNCTEAWIEAAMAKGVRYFLLKAAGRACGCVALEQARPHVFYLERLAVLPSERHKGYGQALVQFALREAAQAGCRRLEIGIIAEHVELRHWYEKMGFITGATKALAHLPFKVTLMHLDLT
jgi:GNAT superfamily N-acetyltransferase